VLAANHLQQAAEKIISAVRLHRGLLNTKDHDLGVGTRHRGRRQAAPRSAQYQGSRSRDPRRRPAWWRATSTSRRRPCVVDKAGSRITSIELATGEHARASYRDCIAVTAHGQQIWILPERGELEEFRNLATLRSGSSPNREIEVKLASAVVVAANASHLFVASDRGELARIDRTTAELQPLSIQLGDEPIQGMTATRTRLYIAGRRGIHELELSTGRRLRTLFATEPFGALTAPRAPATAPRP
jgi:hypothetical protein